MIFNRLKTKAAALVMMLAFLGLTATARAETEQTDKVKSATEVLTEISGIPEKAIPPSLLKNAYGVAVIPGVIKVGFVIGGRYGKGIVSVKRDNGSWSDPSFVTLTGGSFGWQIGAQSTDVILVFKSNKGIDGIKKGKFTLGADAAVAAGPVGRQAEAATDVQMKAEIYSYSRSRGLFAGISLEGAALQIDTDANGAFYRKEGITADEIFKDMVPRAPGVVAGFKKALTDATTRTEEPKE